MKQKISDLIKEVLELSGYTETAMGEYLGLTGRGMVAQYKAGLWDNKTTAPKTKHIQKLEKLKSEILEITSDKFMQRGDLNTIISQQTKRIERLETDVDFLKTLVSKLQKK